MSPNYLSKSRVGAEGSQAKYDAGTNDMQGRYSVVSAHNYELPQRIDHCALNRLTTSRMLIGRRERVMTWSCSPETRRVAAESIRA